MTDSGPPAEQREPVAVRDLVVGVDGSESSLAALTWAAEHRETDQRVHVVFAVESLSATESLGLLEVMEPHGADGRAMLLAALERTLGDDWARVATLDVIWGAPSSVLTTLSEGAEQVVVGSRGHGALVAGVVGSVGRHLIDHARCAVTVVGPKYRPAPAGSRVYVGLQDTPGARAALRWAVEHGRTTHPVHALAVWSPPVQSAAYPGVAMPDGDAESLTRAMLEDVLTEELGPQWRDRVVGEVACGAPSSALAAASEGADSVIVGRSTDHSIRIKVLGHLSSSLLTHCSAPVTVVKSAPAIG